MKVKCIKQDLSGLLTLGKVYDIRMNDTNKVEIMQLNKVIECKLAADLFTVFIK